MPMTLPSWDTNGVVYSNIALLTLRQSKWCATWLFGHATPLVLVTTPYDAGNGVMWCKSCCQWYYASLGSRLSKWGATWLFVMWCHCPQCHMMPKAFQWHHWISYIKKIRMRCNINFLVLWHYQCYHWQHMMPVLASHYADSINNSTIAFLRSR